MDLPLENHEWHEELYLFPPYKFQLICRSSYLLRNTIYGSFIQHKQCLLTYIIHWASNKIADSNYRVQDSIIEGE